MKDKKIFGFAGWSGSGKTTLIEQLIPRFRAQGISVSLIKHSHHAIEIDQPGKDSYRHRMAGCEQVLISASTRWALIKELRGAPELSLSEAIDLLGNCDLVLVEGFKFSEIPKLEIYRETLGKPLLCLTDSHIVAIATDAKTPVSDKVSKYFELNEYDEIIKFICTHVGLLPRTSAKLDNLAANT